MRLLGAIIAGGKSSRFGRDKAFAAIAGRPMLDHVAEALAAQTDALVVVGREWPCFRAIPDRPGPDQGPLGGLCAALHHAAAHGFDAVLTAGCDVLPVPYNLGEILLRSSPIGGGGPPKAVEGAGSALSPSVCPADSHLPRWGRIVEGQPLLGLWPVGLAPLLDHHLATQPDRSMRGWIALANAEAVPIATPLHNLNTRDDYAAFMQEQAA